MPGQASTMVLGTLGLAFLAVVVAPVWTWTQHLSTLVHEGGHATVALLNGLWVRGIKIPRAGDAGTTRDGRGVVSDVLVRMAGYSAPPAAGLALAGAIKRGWSPLNTLLVGLVVVMVLFFFLDNWFGLWIAVVLGSILAFFVYRAGPVAQKGAVIALAWFLLLAGLRDAIELYGIRRGRGGSDADKLQESTHIHAVLWVFAFIAFALFAVVTGGRWLLQ